MSDASQPVQQQKRGPLMTIVLVVVGVIGIIGGIAKMKRGVQEMTGDNLDPKVKNLLTESDQAVEEADKHTLAAHPSFLTLLGDVDNLGLDTIRKDKGEAAREISNHFEAATKQLRLAKQKLDDALALELDSKSKSFVAAKAKAIGLFADVSEKNQEIVRLILDESIATAEELTPKVLEVAASRDELQKQATAAAAEADAITKKAS